MVLVLLEESSFVCYSCWGQALGELGKNIELWMAQETGKSEKTQSKPCWIKTSKTHVYENVTKYCVSQIAEGGQMVGCRAGVFRGVMWLPLLRRWVGRGLVGERLLPLLLRLIKTAPTFLLNHPASQRTKHFYQCLYLDKQWQVGCQGPLWSCYRRTIL